MTTQSALTDVQLREAVCTAIVDDALKPRAERLGLVDAMLAVVWPQLDAARRSARASEESATILQRQIDAQAAELDAMTDLRQRLATAEATIERMERTNRMVNGGARDARERAERAEAELDAARAELATVREQLAEATMTPRERANRRVRALVNAGDYEGAMAAAEAFEASEAHAATNPQL
ncbi:hypothetical protein [Streptomyces sp. CB03911]|uniref:hypothetical protein n=1 Tax=Streptomyces sp. CB03911 TaxID=1804758 RepID=UPI000939FB22|nr:hypothetical protein [Streptomyces sp. CB03911]OKI16556.1 hypothetical protein A6A07_11135 [Streptomyces sp. CB03911]